ncbi:hypothetical protein [Streptomyces europaeiscabiei]|uniref:hypothetical protein n=1 Tax=Streptomyces europaeiscabiei TaxID=146819 RepID=UPI002E2A88D9|nr:hypothetical protein [Streptomyces europaeiscabiei]
MAQTPTGLFPVTDPDRQAKGRQKMHGLALYIAHVWEAAASTNTTLCRDHGLEVDSERVALEIAPALAAIRTLDAEVVKGSQSRTVGQRYQDLQKTDLQGQVVRGLVLARNADIHLPATLDLHVDRVVGEGDGYRVMPSWQLYDALPQVVRDNDKTASSCHDAYRDAVGGHLVIETLLDAFAFFLRCDPTLARRVPGTSDLAYFPLRVYTVHDYERRHPDQPNRADFGSEVRRLTEDTPPSGAGREISYRLTSNGTAVYCGHTIEPFGLRSAFTEAGPQIVRDVRAGSRYVAVATDGAHHVVSADADGRLSADGVALEDYPFPPPYRHPIPQTWLAWWQLATEDPFWYRNQRQGR